MKFSADFTLKVPPSRESSCRAAGHAFGGTSSQLMSCAQQGCLYQYDRDFNQSTNCQMHVSSLIAFSIKDSVVIFHGPIGCGSHSHLMDSALKSSGAARGEPRLGARWLSSNLTETDVITGGGQKLQEAIIGADRLFQPTAIFVLNTCTPSIIGDDIDEEIKAAQSQVSAPVVPVHCSGFKSKVISTAYDAVYHGLLKKFDFGPVLADKPQGRVVNLFNAWSMGAGDEAEIKRLLGAVGLEARVFVEFKSPDQWRAISQGDLNVSLCHVHDLYFLEYLKEKYQQPYVTPDIPIGIHNTRLFVRQVSRFFGLEKTAEKILDYEEAKLQKALLPLKKHIKDRKAVLVGGYLRIGSTALLLHELGLKVLSLTNFNYDAFGNHLYQTIEEKIGPVAASVSSQPSELLNQVKRLQPDVSITHAAQGVWLNKAGIPSLPLFAQRFPYFGFRGAYTVATRLQRILANPNFAKNLGANINLPFLDQWYKKDPFHYLVNSDTPGSEVGRLTLVKPPQSGPKTRTTRALDKKGLEKKSSKK